MTNLNFLADHPPMAEVGEMPEPLVAFEPEAKVQAGETFDPSPLDGADSRPQEYADQSSEATAGSFTDTIGSVLEWAKDVVQDPRVVRLGQAALDGALGSAGLVRHKEHGLVVGGKLQAARAAALAASNPGALVANAAKGATLAAGIEGLRMLPLPEPVRKASDFANKHTRIASALWSAGGYVAGQRK